MSNQPKIKKGFYKGFLEDKKDVNQEQTPPNDQIVIINKKERDSFLKVLFNALGAIFRFVIYIVVFGLSSVGLTALLNEEVRNKIINLFL